MIKSAFLITAMSLIAVLIPGRFAQGAGSEERPSGSGGDVPEGTIVALGDSLTEGFMVRREESYPSRLAERLKAAGYHYKVFNSGISGETSGETLGRLGRILREKPDIVILEIGVNDGFMGVPVSRIKSNITEIVRRLKGEGITVVLAGMQIFPWVGDEYAKDFGEIYPDIARREGVILVPIFLEKVVAVEELNLSDGVHPNAKGYRIIAETVYPYAVEAIEKVRKAEGR